MFNAPGIIDERNDVWVRDIYCIVARVSCFSELLQARNLLMHAIVCRSTEALFLVLRLYRLAAITVRAVILINETHVFSMISFGCGCSSGFGCFGFAVS